MRLSGLSHGHIAVVELRRADGAPFGRALVIGGEVDVRRFAGSGEVMLVDPGPPLPVTGDRSLLDRMERDRPRLMWIAGRSPDGLTLTLQIHEFGHRIEAPEPLALGVDEKIVDDVRAHLRQSIDASAVADWLAERLLLPADPAGMQRAIVTAGPRPDIERAFRLHGGPIAADVTWHGDRPLITRVAFSNRPARPSEHRPPVLLRARLTIVDATQAGTLRGVARAELDRLVAQAGSYLGIWRRYWTLEGRRVIERRRAFGVVPYTRFDRDHEGRWRFAIDGHRAVAQRFARLGEGQAIELDALATVPPAWWRLLGLPDDDGRPAADDDPDEEAVGELLGQPVRDRRTTFSGQVVDVTERHITLDPDARDASPPPKAGVLLLSIDGDRKRLQRQRDADDRIRSAASPMPQLGLILEGHATPPARHRRHIPITPAVREAFGGEPTPAQIAAIDAAINTPDIAVIQGPPGTGKTRTLAALQVRLAELDEKGAVINGRALISSFQHDAVEHAAGEVEVYGLPAVKIGRRRDAQSQLDRVDRWLAERVAIARAHIDTTPAAATLDEARRLAVAIMHAPRSFAEVSATIERILTLGSGQIAPEHADALRARLAELTTPRAFAAIDPEDRALYRRALWGLYDDPIAFADGGPRQARKALLRLRHADGLDAADRALIQAAADWTSATPPPFLAELGRLRDRLLDALLPDSRPADRRFDDAELHRRLGDALDDWAARNRASAGGVADVLADYADTLEGDALGSRATLARYTRVLAATCQQAASGRMATALGVEGGRSMAFDSVVVDEAARANPLDLLIPLALAERRIVLVGDHRQLPHLLEPEIERELSGTVAEEEAAALRESLFERLFTELRVRQARDGLPRVVTLDRQYRMHPVLGDFVSRRFYEAHGETAITAGRPAEDFAHDLPGFAGACAAWIDIPHAAGGEDRDERGSVRRPAEARRLAARLRTLLEAAPHLSFGVIAFYRAQVDAIWQALAAAGLAVRAQNGAWQVAPAFATLADTHRERLRVGTVDAFQGKEFDVVLLSMTRSRREPAPTEAERRRAYGHLMLDNRLCVAMSRQRRLLVLVGDAAMVTSPGGREAVAALHAFHELCGGQHGRRLAG
ncbi:MAG: AAA domain-containing protein [bacterium]